MSTKGIAPFGWIYRDEVKGGDSSEGGESDSSGIALRSCKPENFREWLGTIWSSENMTKLVSAGSFGFGEPLSILCRKLRLDGREGRNDLTFSRNLGDRFSFVEDVKSVSP